MLFENISIGTDIEEIDRFKNKTLDTDSRFLNYVFTPSELEYCFSKSLPHFHLCARFCAKEAVVKAISAYNIKDVFYKDVEITNKSSGYPVAVIKKYPDIKIKISLSHSKTYATATAITFK